MEAKRPLARGTAHPLWRLFLLALGAGVLAHSAVDESWENHPAHFWLVLTAARLESEAPVGGVVIGAETAAALPPGAVLERLAPLEVKGKEEPVDAYLLRGLAGGS